MKRQLLSFFSALILLISFQSVSIASNLPISHEATLIEAVSPSEIAIHAAGISLWQKGDTKKRDMDNFLLRRAMVDGQRAAVYFVLFMDSDPLLSNEDEKKQFEGIQEEFFDADNIRKFISFEGSVDQIRRTKREIKKKKKYELKIENDYKVNKELIKEYLVNRGILIARDDLVAKLGMPLIMVIPATKKGVSPLDELRNDENISHAAKAIESFLTARQYEVIVPEQSDNLSDLVSSQNMLAGIEDDYSYQLALSIGSDVYITYDISLESGSYGTRKAVVNVRAYETTTARLLGTETGYSPSAKVAEKVLIENAINDAIDKVLSRIMNYWKSDLEKGIQYKLVITLSDEFTEDETEELAFFMEEILPNVTARGLYKENIVSAKTLDYTLWSDPEKFRNPTKLYRTLKTAVGEHFSDATLKRVNLNRKLLILKIEASYE